jgi:FkbM family methyltransferase
MRDLIRAFARMTRLSRPLRTLYHRAFYARRTTTAACAGITRTFFTPTPTIAEHVHSLTGEGPVLEMFLEHLHERDIIWDVGAGYGLYALFAAARLHSGGAVRAFEPEPVVRALLAKNIALNNAGQVSVLPIALGDSDGQIGLFASASPNVGTSALVQRLDYPVQQSPTSVSILRGDSVIARGIAQRPAVLKIDVEGAEFLVISGLANTLRLGTVRLICCEIHPKLLPLYGSSADRFEDLLASFGFRILFRHTRGTEYHVLCHRTP